MNLAARFGPTSVVPPTSSDTQGVLVPATPLILALIVHRSLADPESDGMTTPVVATTDPAASVTTEEV